jgi:GNAT superfamily N-acetyltransferase
VTVTIRPPVPGEESDILAMVRELAEFEHALDECTMTEEQLRRALFGEPATVRAYLADVDGEPAATALWFHTFSTWDGVAGVYLEDLFVRPAFRRHGLARALLSTLARDCVAQGYTRLSWAVLDWNSDAIALYEAVGGRPQDDWITYRLSGEDLSALAGS